MRDAARDKMDAYGYVQGYAVRRSSIAPHFDGGQHSAS